MTKVRYQYMLGTDFKIMPPSSYLPKTNYASVYDAYGTPSEVKKNIWEYWRTKFIEASESPTDYIGVCSRNVNMFTIGGVVTIMGNKIGFYITKTRTECWEIVRGDLVNES